MLRRLVPLLGVNAVPLGGVFLAGWSPATALTLYWWENLTGSALVALRIALHRALTRKRGHQRLQLGLHSSVDYEARGRKRREREAGEAGSFLGEFLVYAGAGTALHGVLLWALLRTFLESGPEGDQLRLGVCSGSGSSSSPGSSGTWPASATARSPGSGSWRRRPPRG
jgi:hypothetical protein